MRRSTLAHNLVAAAKSVVCNSPACWISASSEGSHSSDWLVLLVLLFGTKAAQVTVCEKNVFGEGKSSSHPTGPATCVRWRELLISSYTSGYSTGFRSAR